MNTPFFKYNIDYASFNSVYKIDLPTDSAKQIAEEKKRKEKKKKQRKSGDAKTDDESDAAAAKVDTKKSANNDIRMFGGSSPSLMMAAPQPYPFYYAPYVHPRNIGPAPTMSTPLLWPPQPQQRSTHYNQVSI